MRKGDGRRLGLRGGPLASMGPQLDSCGRRSAYDGFHHGAVGLQWGRNLTVAEGPLSKGAVWPVNALQWGRNLTVAEGDRCDGRRGYVRLASMGPQLDSCGRYRNELEFIWGILASMGPQLDSCGRRRRDRRRAERHGASMGPQLDSCGRFFAAVGQAWEASMLQWGRNLTVAEGMSPLLETTQRLGFNGAAT